MAVEVVARGDGPGVRRAIETRLQERGIPVREIRLLASRSQLRHPMPLRADLREQGFGPTIMENTPTHQQRLLAGQLEAF